MTGKYYVVVADFCGPFDEAEADTWSDALCTAISLDRKYRGRVREVQVFNTDRHDYDTDGLSERQSELLARCRGDRPKWQQAPMYS